MVLIKGIVLIIAINFLVSCNSGKTEEEMEELWSKAQTTGKIIERSGTKFNSGSNKKLALQDAETRLQSGGGLLGKNGINVDGILNRGNENSNGVTAFGMPINVYLWRGALDTVSFMPLNSADPIGGTILTDWYSAEGKQNERCKLNIFISGSELKTQNLKVTSFCQSYKNEKWVNQNTKNENNIKIENAILNKAKKLKLQSS
tara:strand:- start:23 stop:631 length:609 start_codon:yes stop_codon:yes gene_type:complete